MCPTSNALNEWTEWFRVIEERRPDRTITQTRRHNRMIEDRRRVVWVAFYNDNPNFKLERWAYVVNLPISRAYRLDKEYRNQIGLPHRSIQVGQKGGGSYSIPDCKLTRHFQKFADKKVSELP